VQKYLKGELFAAPSPSVYLLFGQQAKDVSDEGQRKCVHLAAVITTKKAQSLIDAAKARPSLNFQFF
jgi:hypothetical protein